MAHRLTNQEVDQAAAAAATTTGTAAATAEPTPPTLAYGAEGEPVTKLVNLLKELGHDTNQVIHGAAPVLEETVLADVRAAKIALGVTEPAIDVLGELVGPATWRALYDAVRAKLETATSTSSPAENAAQGA